MTVEGADVALALELFSSTKVVQEVLARSQAKPHGLSKRQRKVSPALLSSPRAYQGGVMKVEDKPKMPAAWVIGALVLCCANAALAEELDAQLNERILSVPVGT